MKQILKRKADQKQTGNKAIILNKWERFRFEFIDAIFTKLPGECDVYLI